MVRKKSCAAGFLSASVIAASLVLAPGVSYAEELKEQGSGAEFTIESAKSNQMEFVTAEKSTLSRTATDLGSSIQVATLEGRGAAMVDTSLLEKGSFAAAGQGFVDLSWEAAPGRTYAIFRDDEFVSKVEGSSYRDAQPSAGATHHYRIETLVASEASATSADEVTIRGFEVYVPETDDLLAEASIHNQAIDEGIAAAAAAPAAANGYGTVLYRTFIPQAKIDAPAATCDYGSGYKFGGDNRGFSHSPASARTTLGANLNWAAGGMSSHAAWVDPTKVYNSAGTKVAEKTASAKDVWVKQLAGNTSYVDLRFSVKAGNPFCTSLPNSIQGAFTITVTRNGSYSIISGSHRQMPNHEIYVMGNATGNWKTVYTRKDASELCLIAMGCPTATISGSGSY